MFLFAAGLENTKSTDKSGFAEAVQVASDAKQVILFLGLDGSIEREGQDRGEITLPGAQNELAKAIIAANPKTVVVLINGGMVAIDDLKAQDHVAIVRSVLSWILWRRCVGKNCIYFFQPLG